MTSEFTTISRPSLTAGHAAGPRGCAGAEQAARLLPAGELADPADPEWRALARTWEDLAPDDYMADGGRYRRRRYAAFRLTGEDCVRLPHRPHFQERSHNSLNGGVERWFAPMDEHLANAPLFRALVARTAALIAPSDGSAVQDWLIEAHQFRIEATSDEPGLPTPEGMHRDGRDAVLILYMGGQGFTGGVTRVEDAAGALLLTHRLQHPGEALLLDDLLARHGTSPVEATTGRGWRDTLVLTFAALPGGPVGSRDGE
ncbi:conserved hypothetical protein [Altererythrobacter sp. B11]|uniref:2OG-Fe dioxygenase family protein n=1 Tax=Altererythrobacter sp. B11 TaxID=2060312 RepID=UPI000DC6FE4A|nr:2OG-Fe dioxygenase family protein [Altererythrobacter sp. B11]BBC73428.1 conserved hypothetical protein [Altererythrobacter sp. B11]